MTWSTGWKRKWNGRVHWYVYHSGYGYEQGTALTKARAYRSAMRSIGNFCSGR